METIFSTNTKLQENITWIENKDVSNLTQEEIDLLNWDIINFSTFENQKAISYFAKTSISWWFLFCSWQIWVNPLNNVLLPWIDQQTRQACRNIISLLSEQWVSLKDVVKTTIYITDLDLFQTVYELYKSYFVTNPPRSLVQVSRLPRSSMIEIEVIAKVPEKII